jgi:DcuC family C4-dicarboxylate transporter
MIGLIIALIVTIFVAKMVYSRFKAQTVLMFGGILLMLIAIAIGKGAILGEEQTTGFILFDIFEFIKNVFSNRAGGLGLTIMSVAGFAKYMDHIGASNQLVKIATKPLEKVHAPYVVLALSYIVGQILNIFIPSASGLGVLLMVTMYPILVSLGVSKLSATAVTGTAACLDLGPGSGNSNLAATTAGMDVSVYFVKYQIPIAIAVMITIAVLHYIVQKRLDAKMEKVDEDVELSTDGKTKDDSPTIYAILPMIPLFLILVFSKLLVSSIKMNVVTAMLIGIFISLVFEVIRLKDVKKVFESIQIFFDGMGMQFAKVVTLIVAGQTFAQGLISIGAIDTLISGAQSLGYGANIMIIVMTAIISVSAVVMGSGNAPFFAFASLAPSVATQTGIAPVLMLLPMQFASGIARSVSPITGVIVAVSGVAQISPFELVKRTAIPMAGALIVTIVANFIVF